jgi:hypothetical protein
MSGAISPLPIYVFMECAVTSFTFTFYDMTIRMAIELAHNLVTSISWHITFKNILLHGCIITRF